MTKVQAGTVETGGRGGPRGSRRGREAVSAVEGCEGFSKTQGNRGGGRELGEGVAEGGAAATTRAEAGGTKGEGTGTDGADGADGATEEARADEKEIGSAKSHEVEWTVRCKKPRDISSVAVARTGAGGASAKIEVTDEGGGAQRLAA